MRAAVFQWSVIALLMVAVGQDDTWAMAPPPPPIVSAPAAPPPPPGTGASFPRPINPGAWITQEDYPAAARRANAQGPVGIRLDVDATGRPTNCMVTRGSGNADLDAAACQLLARRGRFEPARNGRGVAIPGSYVTTVQWKLRGDFPPLPKPGEMVITLTVAPDGSVSDCTFAARGDASTAVDPCKTAPRFAPQPADGGAKPRRIRLTNRVEYLDGL